MDPTISKELEQTLSKPDLHLEWLKRFRNPENERFFELAFDYITRQLCAPAGSTILDCGCGTCAHSVRLAKRGFHVVGIDISDSVLDMARERVAAMGLSDRISLQREDLLRLSFPKGQFDYAICWGVLMHVAEIELALTELHRVLKPGGLLVLSEINVRSVHALSLRILKSVLGKSSAADLRVPAGIESWDERESGRFVTRHTDMRWLRRTFERTGFRIRSRTASQFSEIYTRLKSSNLRSLIHGFNRFYFRFCKLPGPALGNIIIAERMH